MVAYSERRSTRKKAKLKKALLCLQLYCCVFPRHNSLKGKHSVLSFQRASDIPKETENLLTLSKFCLYSNCQNNNQISGRESTQWASDIRMEAGSLFAILSWSVFPFLEGPFVSNIVASFLKMHYVFGSGSGSWIYMWVGDVGGEVSQSSGVCPFLPGT